MREVTLGLVMFPSVRWDKAANYQRAEGLIRRVADQGAQIVCTHEGFLEGYVVYQEENTPERFLEIAEPLDGPYVQRLRTLSDELNIYLAAGLAERDVEQVYNTVVFLGPQGQMVGRYRKTHMGAVERGWYARGTEFPVFDTPFCKAGIMICYDRQFPEVARLLALQGAEVILNPSWGIYGEMNQTMVRTRAYENRLYLAHTNPFEGLIINPLGEVLAAKGTNEDTLVRTVDLDFIQEARTYKYRDLLEDRQPELYIPLVARKAEESMETMPKVAS